jgi:hypothetical protein
MAQVQAVVVNIVVQPGSRASNWQLACTDKAASEMSPEEASMNGDYVFLCGDNRMPQASC